MQIKVFFKRHNVSYGNNDISAIIGSGFEKELCMFLFRVFRNSLSFLSSDLRMVLSQIADCASSIAVDRREDGTVSLHFIRSV